MGAKQKALARAAELEAKIEGDWRSSEFGWDFEVTVESGPGRQFVGDQIHGLVCRSDYGEKKKDVRADDAWEDALDRMSWGVEPCDVPDCDTCEEGGE